MTGDEMAAEFAVRAQRALEIHQVADLGELQVGQPPGFLKQVKLEEPALAARSEFHNRQTTAVYRHTRAKLQPAPDGMGANGKLNGLLGRPDGFHRSSFFDNTCEHKT